MLELSDTVLVLVIESNRNEATMTERMFDYDRFDVDRHSNPHECGLSR